MTIRSVKTLGCAIRHWWPRDVYVRDVGHQGRHSHCLQMSEELSCIEKKIGLPEDIKRSNDRKSRKTDLCCIKLLNSYSCQKKRRKEKEKKWTEKKRKRKEKKEKKEMEFSWAVVISLRWEIFKEKPGKVPSVSNGHTKKELGQLA